MATLQATYILTAVTRNSYVEMTLVSMLSLKLTNPDLPITLLTDARSADYLSESCHSLLDTVDDFKVADTPDGSDVFRHRWMKTQLGVILPGDLLFLDSDTLIRGPLAPQLAQVRQFAAVPNHHGATVTEQIWSEDRDNLHQMGWSDQFPTYFNSGVWLCRAGPGADAFYKSWHEMWRQSVDATGRLRDQPSFNRSLVDTGMDIGIFPRSYNEQLKCHWKNASSALIWHFFATELLDNNSFSYLIRAAKTDSIRTLRAKVARAISAAAPWPNIDPLAIRLSHRAAAGAPLPTVAEMWLQCRRMEACCWLTTTPFRRLKSMFK